MGEDGEPTGIKLPYVVTLLKQVIKFYLLEETYKQKILKKKNKLLCTI